MKIVFACALIGLTGLAWAHGGEDHDAPPAPLTQSVAPRAAATTELFEVVAVAADKQLLVYVDRHASNEPVRGAKVEIEGIGGTATARESEPGTYVLELPSPLAAGKHALAVSVEDGEAADLLSLSLDATAMAPAAAGGHGARAGWLKLAAGSLALVLLAGIGVIMRRRRGARKAV